MLIFSLYDILDYMLMVSLNSTVMWNKENSIANAANISLLRKIAAGKIARVRRRVQMAKYFFVTQRLQWANQSSNKSPTVNPKLSRWGISRTGTRDSNTARTNTAWTHQPSENTGQNAQTLNSGADEPQLMLISSSAATHTLRSIRKGSSLCPNPLKGFSLRCENFEGMKGVGVKKTVFLECTF